MVMMIAIVIMMNPLCGIVTMGLVLIMMESRGANGYGGGVNVASDGG